jgi:hypothetical protein
MQATLHEDAKQYSEYRTSKPRYNIEFGPRPYKDPENLRGLYLGEDFTQGEIAEFYEVDQATISRWFSKFDISTGYGESDG